MTAPPDYWRDSVRYLQAAEQELATPSLFGLMGTDPAPPALQAAE